MSAINVAGWLMIIALFAGMYRLYGVSWTMAIRYAGLTLAAMGTAAIGLHLAFLP